MGKLVAKTVLSAIRAGKPGRYGDGGGLYLMIPVSGLPYWMLRYTVNKKRKSMTLGKVKDMSLAEARSEVATFKKQIREGADPLANRKRDTQVTLRTVDELFNDWYQELQKRLKHPDIPKRIYTNDIAPHIGESLLESVTPMDIRTIIQGVAATRPTVANDALMYCKQLFNHAIKLNLIQGNPASAFTASDAGGLEQSRNRTLTIKEIKAVFEVFRAHDDSFTRDNYLACSLLLVLGVRKGELTESLWSEFDLESAVWELPAERSKSGTSIVIPLPKQAVNWLQELKFRSYGSDYVFPSRRRSKSPHMGKDTLNRAISKLFGIEPGRAKKPPHVMGDIEHFTVHDLRRTCRSLLAAAGVPGHVAERCLNHKLKGVEGIYDRHDYLSERREALQKVADLVSPIVDDLSNVVPFTQSA